MYYIEDIKQSTKKNLQLPGFSKLQKEIAEKHYRLSCNADTIEKIHYLQKALSLYPFKLKYHVAYAILMRKEGDIDTAFKHEQLASGLKLARKKQIQLGISGNSVYRMALIQYYTGMFHNWNKGYAIASDLINSYSTIYAERGRSIPSNSYRTIPSCGTKKSCGTISKIANSPHSNRPEVFAKSCESFKPKSGNARIQWPGANAAMPKWGAAVIVFFMLNIAALNVSANDNTNKKQLPHDSIVWYPLQNNSNTITPDNQIAKSPNALIDSQLTRSSNIINEAKNTPFGLDRIALFLLILPLMALARAALPGKSKIILSILLSSIFALGMNSAVNGQAASGFGIVRDTNDEGQNLARVTYIMAENDMQCLDTNTFSDGSYFFNNIDLITTVVDKPSLEELTNYIGTGQDHNFNMQTKEQPSVATVYNLLGQPITTINPTWDGEIAHYYWDGSVNGASVNVNMYMFAVTINGEHFSQKIMQTNSGQYVGNIYETNNANAPPAYSTRHYSQTSLRGQSPKQSVEYSTSSNATARFHRVVSPSPTTSKSSEEFDTKFYVHLNPDPLGDQFLPQVDTVWLHNGSDNEVYHYVQPIPATIDQYFKLVDSNTREGLEHFTIRARDTDASGAILGETQTDANGLALLENIPEDALLYLEYGPEVSHGADTSYYSSKGNTWQMLPDTWFANDTISPDTVKLALPNKNLIIPQTELDPAPATIWTPASYISEMVNGSYMNIEQACRNEIRIWIDEDSFSSLQLQKMTTLLQDVDSLFYGTEQFTYTIVTDSINTQNLSTMTDYHHSENYHPGELGYNIRDGSGHVILNSQSYSEFNLNEQNTDYVTAVFGGNIWTSTIDEEFIKETVMRLNKFQNVTSRPSFGNVIGIYPNEYDRAITRIIRINQHNRASVSDERVQSFSLHYLQNYFNE